MKYILGILGRECQVGVPCGSGKTRGLAARPLDLVGYGDEEETEMVLDGEENGA